jgi:ribosomal protein S18 acetylase RimI-like enzyme
MTGISVRPFKPTDRQAVLQIAADTAFFGEPIEAYLDDRRLFQDAFYSYYTDHEPQSAWVADYAGSVIGFLTGCVSTRRQKRVFYGHILPRLAFNLIPFRYRLGRKTFSYIRRLARAWLRGEFPPADLSSYPAHLHINVMPAFRGQGIGRKLIEAYLQRLSDLQINGVHLHTTDLNAAACKLYESLGFRAIAARQTSLWQGLKNQPVDNRCYARHLR